MLYIGKTCDKYENGSIIDVELVPVKEGDEVVDHILPPSLIGRVREAGVVTGEKNPLEDENAKLKKENEALKKEVAELKKAATKK